MIYQAFAVLVVLAVSQAHPDNYGGGGGGGGFGGGGGGGGGYASGPIPYSFSYAVNDDYKGTNFGQKENSDGNNVWGSYVVALPDGRKQQVDYTADHHNGFVAKVSYSGKAQHPKVFGPAITFPQNGGGGGGGYH